MTCHEVQEQLTALLDGELPAEPAAAIQAHLAGCAECSAVRGGLAAVLRAADAWRVRERDISERVQREMTRDETEAMRLDLARLRAEVGALRAEVADLKRRAERPAPTAGRERSLLRFPYSAVPQSVRPVL